MALVDEIRENEQRDSGSRAVLFVIAIIVAAGAFAFVVINSFDQKVYYYTVSEATVSVDDLGNDQFRLKGNVAPGSHFLREGTLDEHRFTLLEGEGEMPVAFHGPLPDTFQDDAEVVALGSMNDEGVFVAEEVAAKCPSRYESTAPTANEDF